MECHFCGAQMEEADVIHEQDGGRAEMWVCPNCGSLTNITHIPSDNVILGLFDDDEEETPG